jgi:hypothetical protein
MKSNTRLAHDVSLRILSNLRERLGDHWDQIDPRERELIIACAKDAAELELRALAVPVDPAEQYHLLREKAQIHAQLASLTGVASVRLANAFWDAVRSMVNGAVMIAFAAM